MLDIALLMFHSEKLDQTVPAYMLNYIIFYSTDIGCFLYYFKLVQKHNNHWSKIAKASPHKINEINATSFGKPGKKKSLIYIHLHT